LVVSETIDTAADTAWAKEKRRFACIPNCAPDRIVRRGKSRELNSL
jgi:predicted RNA-binding Zn-ribbon protein involved in translation (DUF1610 family)